MERSGMRGNKKETKVLAKFSMAKPKIMTKLKDK